MKKLLLSCLIILSQLLTVNAFANNFLKTEAMLVLMAGVSAKQPEAAAVIDTLALLSIPNAPEYKTDWERTVAYIGLGALALYNYDAEDEERSEEDIFTTNLVVFNIILAGQLFGLSDDSPGLKKRGQPASVFSFQLTPEGGPAATWQYSFD